MDPPTKKRKTDIVLLPMSQSGKSRDGKMRTHMAVERFVYDLISKDWNLRYGMKLTKVTSDVATSGKLVKTEVRVPKNASGPFTQISGTQKFHNILLRAVGVINDKNSKTIGKGTGKYSIDHKDGDPSNNRLSNLRLVRDEINSVLKSTGTSGIRKYYKKFRVDLPMYTTFKKQNLSEEMKACGYDKKSWKLVATRAAAEAAKKRAGLAAFNQLKLIEPSIFNAYRFSGDLNDPITTFSIEQEVRLSYE